MLQIYEEEKKNYLLTCLICHGLNHICLGFSNGFCCFIFLKNFHFLSESTNPDQENKVLTYFKCFSHRISEMCLIPLSTVNYLEFISCKIYENVEDVLHAFVKKDTEEYGCLDQQSDASIDMRRGIRDSCLKHGTNSKKGFYQVVYNHESNEYKYQEENEINTENRKTRIIHIENFLLVTFDHTGDNKIFSVENENKKIEIKNILQTDIDVKNKKSKIISVNYVMRQKKRKMGILLFVGDEYGCIFIIYINIPIQLKSDEIVYNFSNSFIKSKQKLRVHNNRKVFDIKIIHQFIYSCGQNGNIIKYQLYKDENNIYTLYKLCVIKVGYYSSIYKLLPMHADRTSVLSGHSIERKVQKEQHYCHNSNEDVEEEAEQKCLFEKRQDRTSPEAERERENLQNMLICCFKGKKFVLHDLKNKIEYLSIECGGFRRPLSIFTKFSINMMKEFSFCFCKEKNIHFYLKKLQNNNQGATIPYEQIYINSGFHAKNVSCVLWVNKSYLCTCSEDGTIKLVYLKKWASSKSKINKSIHGDKDINSLTPLLNMTNGKLGSTDPSKYSRKNNNKPFRHINYTVLSKWKQKNFPFSSFEYPFRNTPYFSTKLRINKTKVVKPLNYRMSIIQNVHNHSEPIFHMCFLQNPFYYFKNLKLLTSVGAKNSINIFYLHMDVHKTPIIYHIEKVRVQKFSSDLRFLCVQGNYIILSYRNNKYLIRINLFIGTSLGHLLHYSGVYEFVYYKNIIFCKIVELAHLISSHNLNSTILVINLTNIFLSTNLFTYTHNMYEHKEVNTNLNTLLPSNGILQERDSLEMFEKAEKQNCYYEKLEENPFMQNNEFVNDQLRRNMVFPCHDGIKVSTREKKENLIKNACIALAPTDGIKEPFKQLFDTPNQLNEQFLAFKRKENKTFCGSILCCGLNNGEIHFYYFDTKLVSLLQKVQVHQNGISMICIKKKKTLLYVFTSGDDQSINILTLEIRFPTDVLTHETRRIHLSVMQNKKFQNSHMSSIRSLALFSNVLLSVSWDQYICIWNVKRDKNSNIIIERRKKMKMAVYDVSCLNIYITKKKKIINENLKNHESNYSCLPVEKEKEESKYLSKKPAFSNLKVYLSIAGSSGSLESFCLHGFT
ncbi:hypothetical protein, conserved [Plasmodium gonderi]|uniref:Uncharacterized protein n=1 Tax=Plasmodium gonderi TaxID=77519 RepID=A0A1Y1JKI8_PLAGO|nr:hypothetical protein, conserved [Plasmodium gonderi]GAW81302.1 hypothetical protein, conserved [Plasmodium gonderi]